MNSEYSRVQKALVALIFLALFGQILYGMTHTSVTWDELCFIGAGKAVFATGNTHYMLLADHPPLSYYLNSLLLIPLSFDDSTFEQNLCWQIGNDVLFHSDYDFDRILFASRIVFAFLSLFAGWYVLRWSRELFGMKASIFSLFLYSFNPSIIAYSGVTTADFTVGMMMFIATYYWWKYFTLQNMKHLYLASAFFAFAFLSKITALVLLPVFFLLWLYAIRKTKGYQLKKGLYDVGILVCVTFLLIFGFHLFQFGTLAENLPAGYYVDTSRDSLAQLPFSSLSLTIFDSVPLPFPIYIGMVGNILYLSTQDKTHYVFGMITDGVWYFSILSFLLKTAVPLLVLLGFLLFQLKHLQKKITVFTLLALLLPVLFTFLFFSFTSKMSGIRHLLAVYPFLFVFAGAFFHTRLTDQVKKYLLGTIVVLYVLSAVLIAPHYLSYITVLGGGPVHGTAITVGANIDQGQDLKGLKQYMDAQDIDRIQLSYWGSVDPADYGITYDKLPSPYFQPWENDYSHIVAEPPTQGENCGPVTGLLAISVTNLKNVALVDKQCYDWLDAYEPVERIGYSMYLYDIPANEN